MSSGSRWFRWSVFPGGPLGGSSADTTPSATTSTFVASAYANDADGSTATTLTGTARNAASEVLVGKSWTLTLKNNARVSAANSIVNVSGATVAANTNVTVTFGLEDEDGLPFVTAFPVTAIVPSSTGTGNTFGTVTAVSGAPGAYTVTFQSSVEEAKTISVTVAGRLVTDTAAVTVGAGGAPSFAFSSDWLTATGRTNSAITDGGAFDGQACGDQSVVGNPSGIIVTADSLSAPAALTGLNAFQLAMVGSDCCMIQVNDALPASTTHWGQFWVVNNENATKNDHPVAYHNIHGSDPIQAVPWQRYGNVGGSVWQMGVPGAGSYPYNRFYSPNLTLGVWYRYEWMMEYLTSDTFRFYPRIYNAAGTLLYTVDDYEAEGGTTLQEWYDVPNVLTLGGDGASESAEELARNFGIGNEGPDGAPDNDLTWSYAGLRLSTTGWIGGSL